MDSTRRAAAAVLLTAALLAIAGFTALGSVFDYPQILKSPTEEILALYRPHRTAVTAWFLVLVAGAALLAPAGILLGRLTGSRWVAGLGVAAAAVQVIGLSRWVLWVPRLSDEALDPARTGAAYRRFELLHTWLGTALGETVGYALTAAFTLLVARALGGPRRVTRLGQVAAVLIATGVLVPLGVRPATLTNFAGYVLWCLWLLVVAALLRRGRLPGARRTALPAPA